MTRIVRAAMTQTKNAYPDMPSDVEGLEALADKLGDLRDANLEHHGELIRKAASQGAKIVGLGELFTGPYFALERRAFWRGLAEDPNEGPTATFMSALAKDLGVVIVAPLYEKTGDKSYNTAIVVDADGAILGKYRKSHIPQGSNEKGQFVERFYYGRSDEAPFFPVFETAVGKLGVAICYDRHFEGVMRTLAHAGAEIVMSPAVTFGDQSRRMWQLEFQVDACRHNIYIGGSNRLGVEPPWTIEYFGESYFAGPHGKLEDLSDDERLVISDLDLDVLSAGDGSGWNLIRDFRADIYED